MSEESFGDFVRKIETMDAEATQNEIVLSHETFDRYMGLLQSPYFLRKVKAGEVKVKEKRGKNVYGDDILLSIEVWDMTKKELIFFENTAALIEMSERNSAATESKSN